MSRAWTALSCYLSGMWSRVPSLRGPLKAQIDALGREVTPILQDSTTDALGVLLTGSCSRGEATYRSDVDLLVVLATAPLNYSRVRTLRDRFEARLSRAAQESPLACEIHFVLSSVFETREPAMRGALKEAKVLSDPTGELARRLEAFRKAA